MAQLPVVPFSVNTALITPNYTNLLYADYETDTTESLSSAYVNGSIIVYWTNIAPINPTATSWDLQTSSAVWPYYTNNVTPTGKAAVDFIGNNNTIGANAPHWSSGGSNQPNTLITVLRMSGGFPVANPVILDCSAGARSTAGITAAGFTFFSGSGVFVGDGTTPTGFFVLTIVYNGANSYVRTNGVLVGTGNPSTAGIGTLFVGNDITQVSKFVGEIASYRLYAEAPNTNNLHTAEQNVASRYLGITLPSP